MFIVGNTFLALPFSTELIMPSPNKEDKIQKRVYQLSLILRVLFVCAKFIPSFYDKNACPTSDGIWYRIVQDNVWI
jgi:hypothetical protein